LLGHHKILSISVNYLKSNTLFGIELVPSVALAKPIATLLSSLAAFFLSVKLLIRYKNKKLPATKNLFYFVFSVTLGFFVSTIGRTLAYLEPDVININHPYLVGGILINVLALLALVKFASIALNPITVRLYTVYKLLALLNLISLIAHLMLDTYNTNGTWIIHLLLFAVFSIACYSLVYKSAKKIYNTTDNMAWKKGVNAIAKAQLASISVLIFWTLDLMIPRVFDQIEFYSIFWFIGTFTATLAIILSYIGYTLPKWYIGDL
jgi:hypothetical protein